MKKNNIIIILILIAIIIIVSTLLYFHPKNIIESFDDEYFTKDIDNPIEPDRNCYTDNMTADLYNKYYNSSNECGSTDICKNSYNVDMCPEYNSLYSNGIYKNYIIDSVCSENTDSNIEYCSEQTNIKENSESMIETENSYNTLKRDVSTYINNDNTIDNKNIMSEEYIQQLSNNNEIVASALISLNNLNYSDKVPILLTNNTKLEEIIYLDNTIENSDLNLTNTDEIDNIKNYIISMTAMLVDGLKMNKELIKYNYTSDNVSILENYDSILNYLEYIQKKYNNTNEKDTFNVKEEIRHLNNIYSKLNTNIVSMKNDIMINEENEKKYLDKIYTNINENIQIGKDINIKEDIELQKLDCLNNKYDTLNNNFNTINIDNNIEKLNSILNNSNDDDDDIYNNNECINIKNRKKILLSLFPEKEVDKLLNDYISIKNIKCNI